MGKLEKLRDDYTAVTGESFQFFYCPILLRDADVQLSVAHIVNKAFHSPFPMHTTIQRSDVDSFYGTHFEADFTLLQDVENLTDARFVDVILEKEFHKKFGPQIHLQGKQLDSFPAKPVVPDQFTKIYIHQNDKIVPFVLKISPADMEANLTNNWELVINKDIRIQALVSLIKAAYLTLFDIFGYHYALSESGLFVGSSILGKFFLQNKDKTRDEVSKNAFAFFNEFRHMVRPLIITDLDFQGTINDGKFIACFDHSEKFWALIIFVKTGNIINGVILPHSLPIFIDFLKNDNEMILGRTCQLQEGKAIIISSRMNIPWAKTGLLYPNTP